MRTPRKTVAVLLFAAGTLPAAQQGTPCANLLDPPRLVEVAPDRYTVEIETSTGVFEIEVTRSWAPHGADRFYNLVKCGFYQNSRFHRVVRNYVAEFGLAADPVVGQVWMDAYIPDDPRRKLNGRGTVSFAAPGPNRRTTQVFINLKNNTRLNREGFAPIGRVTRGFDVVRRLNAEYGDAPDPGRILGQGNQYLNEWFPELDYIIQASIVE